MEIWKDIPFYENLYEASNFGRIRTKEGKTTKSARFKKRVWKQRIMKYKVHKSRLGRIDYRVSLWKDGKVQDFNVARLIAATFHENLLFSKYTVNHIDGNSQNNNANNLEWVSLSDNIKYGFKHGQYTTLKAITVKNANGEITSKESCAELDRYLNRSIGYTSNRICKGKDTVISSDGTEFIIIRRWSNGRTQNVRKEHN